MAKLTAAQVAELRAKATPGPWSAFASGRTVAIDIGAVPRGTRPCIVDWLGFDGNELSGAENKRNANFIAAAHDMADLIAEQAEHIALLERNAQHAIDSLAEASARIKELKKEAAVGRAINRAALELPEEYQIEIEVELHGGGVTLYARGEKLDFPTNHDGLANEINDATDAARAKEAQG